MGAIEDLKKARDSWQNQKDNNLSDARIADAYIKALSSAIEMVEADKTLSKPSTEGI